MAPSNHDSSELADGSPSHAAKPAVPLVHVRDAREEDMEAIARIYAHHVLHGLATFEEIPPSADEFRARRAAILALGLPYLVATQPAAIETPDSAGAGEEVMAYAYASAYRPRVAYRHTIEDSIYVADGFAGRGIGRALLTALIARCEAGPWRQMVAVISATDDGASVALHERFGFRETGRLDAVGFKFGRWVDTIFMQRPLGPGRETLPGEGA